MDLLIITGNSGAGKTQAIAALEDIGFFCVDNIPPQLITTVADLCRKTNEKGKIAVVTDLRSNAFFSEFFSGLKVLEEKGVSYKILFLKADPAELARRYSETRRRHPLAQDDSSLITELIEKENRLLSPILERADFRIDTTQFRPAQLRSRLTELFAGDPQDRFLNVHCMSFGFKYGQPDEVDLMFDVRCFPNPYYEKRLRTQTGQDEAVQAFVLGNEAMQRFLKQLFDMLDFLLPLYVEEGKSQLVIAIGCTGGKHRSVTVVEELYKHLFKSNYRISATHRDISKA